MQALASRYPQVSFAAVAIKGDRARRAQADRTSAGSRFPVGLDPDGALAALYKVASCPQLTFAERGGDAQGQAMLDRPSRAALHARVEELLAESAAARGSGAPRTGRGAGRGRDRRVSRPRPAGAVGRLAGAGDRAGAAGAAAAVQRGRRAAPRTADRRLAARHRGAACASSPTASGAPGRSASGASRSRRPTASSSARSGSTPTCSGRRSRARCVERMVRGGFLTGGMLDDILMLALLDTGVPVWALDATRIEGPLGIRPSREGEPLGRCGRSGARCRRGGSSWPTRRGPWRCCSGSSRAATSRAPRTASRGAVRDPGSRRSGPLRGGGAVVERERAAGANDCVGARPGRW